jgi:hypothetical protein
MSMISRQKLIEELKNKRRSAEHKVWNEVINMLIHIVNRQPPADQWIPCSERLPKKSHSYVVTEQTKDGRYIMSTRIFRGGKWVIEELYDDVKVIAWMPAEPYKGVE